MRGRDYCYACFSAYHPRSDPQWVKHWTDVRDLPPGVGGSTPLAVIPTPEDPCALREEHVAAIRESMPVVVPQGGGGASASASASGAEEIGQGAAAVGGGGFTIPALNV